MTSTTAEDASVTRKSIVVIFTEQQWGPAETHANSLQEDGESVDLHECSDIDAFDAVDTDRYSRLDILVDTHMCTILMIEEELHEKAKRKFKAVDKKRGKIYLLNRFAQDFDTLFHRLPVNVRRVIEHGGGVPQREYVDSTIGMTGDSTAKGSVVFGEAAGGQRTLIVNINNPFGSYAVQKAESQMYVTHTKSQKPTDTATNDSQKVDMKFDVPEQKEGQLFSKITEEKESIEQFNGVTEMEASRNCVLLTLTLTKGHVITETWVEYVLHRLCDDILSSFLSEGEKFDVDVQRRVQYNFAIPPDPKTHENCIPRIEHEKQVQELIDQQKEKDARTLQWVTSSGYHSAGDASSDYNWDEEVEEVERAEQIEQFSSGVCFEGFMDSSTKDCSKCVEMGRHHQAMSPGGYFIIVHANKSILRSYWAKQKRQERRQFVQKIEKHAAAFCNTNGGDILIHVQDQDPYDRYLGYFDETVMKSLEYILGDTQLPTTIYSRDWLCDENYKMPVHDFILLLVKKTDAIITVDFNTKIANDFESYSPSPLLIMSILSTPVQGNRGPTIKGLPDLRNKNRSIQCRSYRLTDENPQELSEFIDYIWNSLKLKDCITSMSKIPDGGSYYLGIYEADVMDSDGSRTRKYIINGFVRPYGTKEFRDALYIKMNADMCVLDKATMTFQDAPSGLIDVAFHKVQGNIVVLEVAIGYFDGIVFSDRLGPRTYTVTNGHICRMDNLEWLECTRNFPVFKF